MTHWPMKMEAIQKDRLELVYAFWKELAQYPASGIDEALHYLMATLADWIQADNVMWVGGVCLQNGTAGQDPQKGWRGRVVKMLCPSPILERMSAQTVREQDTEPALTTIAITASAGQFRVHRLRDGFVDFERFRLSTHYRVHYQGRGLSDRMWVVVPVNRDAESYFLFDLHHTRRRFSAADAHLAGHALRVPLWFHRRLMLSHGLPLAESRFTPAQRRVLNLLLTDATEAQIATQLRLSQGTVHQYAVELYRKLGVKGRTGLLSLWLGQ